MSAFPQVISSQMGVLLDTLGACVLVLDARGRCLYASAPLLELLRLDVSAALGQPVARILRRDAPRELPPWDEVLALLGAGTPSLGSELETLTRGDGVSFPARIDVHLRPGEGSPGLLVQVRDLTDINRQSKAFHASVRSFRALFDGAGDAIFFLGQGGKVLDANLGAQRMFGHPPTAFIGKGLEGLGADGALAGLAEVLARVFAQGGDQRLEYLSKGVGGVRFPAEMVLYPAQYFGQRAALVMIQDISARKAHEASLLEAKSQAEAASRLKTQFMGNMSHELRTPLNGVIGLGELLLETELDAEQHDYARTMLDSGRALLDILNDILDYTSLDAGRFKSSQTEFSPLMLLDEARHRFASRCAEKGLALEIEPGETEDLVLGDMEAWGKALRRVLDNAVKFTDQGCVTLGLETRAGEGDGIWVQFTVRDTGIGIPPEAQSRVFDAFVQLDGAVTRRHGGTGMGLAVVKSLVQAQGGTSAWRARPVWAASFAWAFRPGGWHEPVGVPGLSRKGSPRVFLLPLGRRAGRSPALGALRKSGAGRCPIPSRAAGAPRPG